jgi:hypothetical protein
MTNETVQQQPSSDGMREVVARIIDQDAWLAMEDGSVRREWALAKAAAILNELDIQLARIGELEAGLREIADITRRQQLPITAEVHGIAKALLTPNAPEVSNG